MMERERRRGLSGSEGVLVREVESGTWLEEMTGETEVSSSLKEPTAKVTRSAES
jgi:hypothetical protein